MLKNFRISFYSYPYEFEVFVYLLDFSGVQAYRLHTCKISSGGEESHSIDVFTDATLSEVIDSAVCLVEQVHGVSLEQIPDVRLVVK